MNLHYLKNKKSVLNRSKQNNPHWDFFISAYNDNDRVKLVFDSILAGKKYWLALPEYDYSESELPSNAQVIQFSIRNEDSVIHDLVDTHIGNDAFKNSRFCIDITGFLRPHILKLVQYIHCLGIKKFDIIYTEPEQYGRKENTQFTRDVSFVRQVSGFEGTHIDDVAHDILIIGVGYDDELISRVISDKDSATIIQLLSLPSLSADMYQESILRLERSSTLSDMNDEHIFFAPANDPFVVASELSKKINQLRRGPVHNIYLSPLATKPQTLGFALYYLNELVDQPASIVFPFSKSYFRETSKGIGRTWLYEITF